MNTLAFGYDLPTAGRSRDFHPLECALAGRTKQKEDAPRPLFTGKLVLIPHEATLGHPEVAKDLLLKDGLASD